MELPSVYLLFRHFLGLLLLVIVIFRAFVSTVSCVPTPKTPSFFQQLVALIDCQSVDIHGVWVTFPSRKIKLLLGGFLLSSGTPCSFDGLCDLVVFMIQCGHLLVPVGNGLEQCFQLH
jgi:hypothetical protein